MEKLSTFKEGLFNKNNLKKMVKAGVFATALGAAVLGGVGCKQPDDGTTIEDPTIDGNQGGNQQGGNQQGGNQQGGNTGNEQGGNDNQGGNTGNEEQVGNYTAPFDKTFGNGNYFAHSFSGENFSFQPDSVTSDVNYYLGKGKTYYTEQVENFKKSVNGRTTYFDQYINDISKAGDYFNLDKSNPDARNMDLAMNYITNPIRPVFADIIKNLGSNADRNTFMICYETVSGEAYKTGLNPQSSYMSRYQDARQNMSELWNDDWEISESFDLDADIDNNNCQQITNTMDKFLSQAANGIGNNVTAADLRQIINISMFSNSLQAMHDRTSNNLKHTSCVAVNDIWKSMEDAAQEAFEAEQNRSAVQNLGLTR